MISQFLSSEIDISKAILIALAIIVAAMLLSQCMELVHESGIHNACIDQIAHDIEACLQ